MGPRSHVSYRLNPDAFDDRLEQLVKTRKDIAEESDFSIPVLSGLYHGRHRASLRVVHQLANVMRCRPGTLFPELRGFRSPNGAKLAAPIDDFADETVA